MCGLRWKLNKDMETFTYGNVIKNKDWYETHINKLITQYPHVKVGNKVKQTIDDSYSEPHVVSTLITKIELVPNGFSLGGIMVHVDSGFSPVYYYELKYK
tara:strand:- start:306 stop:605 length:300 start_codon:yes stop_codon:yes gene_type:complete